MNNAHNNYNLCSVFNVTNAMETRKIKERGAGSEGQFVCTAGWEGSRVLIRRELYVRRCLVCYMASFHDRKGWQIGSSLHLPNMPETRILPLFSPSLLSFSSCLKCLKAGLNCEGCSGRGYGYNRKNPGLVSNYYEMLSKSLELLGLNFCIHKIRESAI